MQTTRDRDGQSVTRSRRRCAEASVRLLPVEKTVYFQAQCHFTIQIEKLEALTALQRCADVLQSVVAYAAVIQ